MSLEDQTESRLQNLISSVMNDKVSSPSGNDLLKKELETNQSASILCGTETLQAIAENGSGDNNSCINKRTERENTEGFKSVEKSDQENSTDNNYVLDDGNVDEDDDTLNAELESTEDENNENETSVLRVDVSQSEIGMFDDSVVDDAAGLHDDGTVSVEDIEHTHEMFETVEASSKLHCSLCGNIYRDPRMLDCLHCFCLACVGNMVQSSVKRVSHIKCPLCFAYTPVQNLEKLPVNVVIKNLIDTKNEGRDSMVCVVCLLHDVKVEPTGQCLDCGDLLCSSCCEKHTFSRHTAKHKVVSLDEESDIPVRNQTLICETHSCQVASFYCSRCNIHVCRDCILTAHSTHNCTPVDSVKEDLRKLLDSNIGSLNKKLDSFEAGDDDCDQTLAFIDAKEEEQMEVLKKGRDEMVEIIENAYDKHLKILSKLFRRYRSHCSSRHEHILNRKKDVLAVKENVDFIFASGKVTEILQMEKHIKSRIRAIEKNIKNTSKKITKSSVFPQAKVHSENVKKMKSMYYFSVTNPASEKESLVNAKRDQMEHRKVSDETPVKSKKKQQGKQLEQSGKNKVEVDGMPELTINLPKFPIGRGAMLKNRQTSLLGEYPGGTEIGNRSMKMDSVACIPAGWRNDTARHFSSQHQGAVFNHVELLMEDRRIVQMRQKSNYGDQPVTLKLRSSVSLRGPDDRKQPNIVDVVFTSLENFVVVDDRNQILKAFSCSGAFLDFINDPGPTSVTYLQNHLLWNSQYSSIKCFDVSHRKVWDILQLPRTAPHPLTSFSNNQCQRFLVANAHRSYVEAFNLEGKLIVSFEPRDKSGQLLKNITFIAAYMNDEIVLIDSQLKKVVVSDFDGRCIGEYSKLGVEPVSACITEHNHIFVTDRARDKVILLNSHAVFLKEWSTLIQAPSALATNGNGTLVVAGVGEQANVYEYHL